MEKTNVAILPQSNGCNNLLNQYSLIGMELLRYENSSKNLMPVPESGILAFRQGVCCVPVEVLESYLEDLLDIEATDESLFIIPEKTNRLSSIITITGLLIAALISFAVAQSAGSLISAFVLMFMLSAPLGVLILHYGPKHRALRRIKFARVVSLEIARRRGRGRGAVARSNLLVDGILRPAFQQGRRISGNAFRLIH